jgi:hypothetical protein
MTDKRDDTTFAKSPHVLPLRDRTAELLQVLIPEFTLRKNRPGPGVCLSLDIKDHMPSIVDREGKREVSRVVRSTGTQARDRLARRLSDFHADPREREYCFDCSAHPLRYANGGVLPVVRLEGRDYFWLFYRDIFPIGWNIANGASDTTVELLDPNRVVFREFGEEVIVADFHKMHLFTFEPEDNTTPLGFLKGALAAWSEKLGVDLLEFQRRPIPLKWVDGPDAVDANVEGRRRETKGYFLSITPEDNAIEVDRIAFINLGQDVALLDGEHRNGKLLNQVIGLFEVDKMRDISRTEFIPDVVFFDGKEWPYGKNEAAARRGELAGVIAKYLGSSTLVRTEQDGRDYEAVGIKYDLCPIARSIITRFFEWEKTERRDVEDKPRGVTQPGGEFDVFVTFRDPDLDVARSLAGDLRQRGFHVFMSSESLKSLGAADYFRAINEALEQSAVLVVVGSRPDRFNSGWVRYEWQSFFAEVHSGRKPYGRVFTFSGGVGIDELPFALRQVQTVPYDAISPESSFDTVASFIGPRDRLRLTRT